MTVNTVLPNQEVVLHNAITSAHHQYGSLQIDIFFVFLAKLKKDDPKDMVYKIHYSELESITERSWNYQQLHESASGMGTIKMRMEGRLRSVFILNHVDYVVKTGMLEIAINDKYRKYFFDLKDNFTVVELQSILKCSSKYAKRLYALGCQWKSVGSMEYTLAEFRSIIGVNNSGKTNKNTKEKRKEQYSQIGELKTYVLNVAMEQIKNNTDLVMDYKFIKSGRKVTGLTFFVAKNITPPKLFTDEGKSVGKQHNWLKKRGFDETQILFILSNNIGQDIFDKEKTFQNEFPHLTKWDFVSWLVAKKIIPQREY